jgi:bifunctional DNA-binding transcriptional regulator/antitoxin component of YhaV-PrlF toxin-antitoxin module
MAKVTSKLQVTVPKIIADQYGIRPGDDIEWVPAGDAIRVVLAGRSSQTLAPGARLGLFDAATERQKLRQKGRPRPKKTARRGWRREDLYARGRAG